MPNVNTINKTLVKQQLEEAPEELQNYIKALEDANKRWEEINKECIKKLKNQ